MTVNNDLSSFRQTATLAAPGSPVPDGTGGYSLTYTALSPAVWRCAIEKINVRMAERHFASTVISKATHVLTGRFHSGMDTNTQVTWRDRAGAIHIANVLDIDDIEGAGVETVAAVSEIAPDPLSYVKVVLADHPTAYFRMEQTTGTTLADSSGNGRNATLSTGLTGLSFVQGALSCGGWAITADGTEGAVSFTHPALTDLTIGAWIKFPTFQTGQKRWITVVTSSAADAGLYVDRQNKKLIFFIHGQTPQVSNTVLLANTWYYVTVTVVGSSVTFYVNGVADGVFASGYSGMTPAYILSDLTSPDQSVGTVDEIEVYNSALTPARLAARVAFALPPS